MPVRWTERARTDLLAIGRFIASDSRSAARRWVARLKERARQAAKAPAGGRLVPELERNDIREVTEGNYRIVYRVTPRAIYVLTVFEGHRTLRLETPPEEPS